MLDLSLPCPRLQRTRGRAGVAIGLRGGRMRLSGLHQSGSARAFLPRIHAPVPEVVFLNTSGGLTGGDKLDYALSLGAGARATGTTQTAERAYASAGGVAQLGVTLSLGPGAALDWLPQETILFDRAALARRTVAEIAGDARLLLAEMVVLGRAAMGEQVSTLDFSDWRELRRDGRPDLVEPLRITDATLGRGAACLGAARAFATVALLAPGAEDALGAVRARLDERLRAGGVEAAASGWDGKCVVRLMAADAQPLKQAVAAILAGLRDGPLPRVWQM